MNILIEKIEYDKKLILTHLMELYIYEFSEYKNTDVNEFGLYGYERLDHYWTDNDRYPYLIRVDGKIAGFVLVRRLDNSESKVHQYSIAIFFVLKKYRKKSVGKEVAFKIFDQFTGEWLVFQLKENKIATKFWRSVISEYSKGCFSEKINSEDESVTQVFMS